MGNLLGSMDMDSAIVVYRGAVNNGISGNVSFAELYNDDIHISGRLTGLKPECEYTLCIHRYGDLRSNHFNTDISDGGFCKITADASGSAVVNIYTDKFEMSQIIGRALLILDFNESCLAYEIIGVTH
jgi:hypothetical protein